jgi:prepilin-type N-terminal cleavage/methylation domain-containing protein
MRKNLSGFTIVELLIVIVVIGILASVTVASYQGVQQKSDNTARLSELKGWHNLFQLHKAETGSYPTLSGQFTCLGTGFPIGANSEARCVDYLNPGYSAREADGAALRTVLSKYGTIPPAFKKPVAGTVGPYVQHYGPGSDIDITQIFQGNSSTQCPGNTTFAYTDNQNLLICMYRVRD